MIIDKDIPIPNANVRPFKGRNRYQSKYPFQQMEIGESVFYPMDGAANTLKHTAYMAAATIQKRYPPLRFSGRTREENGVVGVRIWRIA